MDSQLNKLDDDWSKISTEDSLVLELFSYLDCRFAKICWSDKFEEELREELVKEIKDKVLIPRRKNVKNKRIDNTNTRMLTMRCFSEK